MTFTDPRSKKQIAMARLCLKRETEPAPNRDYQLRRRLLEDAVREGRILEGKWLTKLCKKMAESTGPSR